MQDLQMKVMETIFKTTIRHDAQSIIRKINEETLELSLAIRDKEHENIKKELADCLIVLAQIMHMVGFTDDDLEEKLHDVLDRYRAVK